MDKIKVECDACDGTGIYCGFAEPKGVGVVCLVCAGTGCRMISYKKFDKRKRRKGVKVVCRSAGTIIAAGVGPTGGGVTYEEFLNGKMP